MGLANSYIEKVSNYRNVIFSVSIIFILSILLLPVSAFAIDFLFGLSITLSIMILMTTLFINKPLELNSFPSILLIVTMMRLALNIASTRLILSRGHLGTSAAGHIIESFGVFVMQGSLVIGIIVFTILTIINFIVITKGSGRIAEVSARFSLDAMPGKQMAIDAELSSGAINDQEAKERRKELEAESTFFGAMDGASKFVRGDAIAGILITFINFIAGVIIGIIQRDMTFDKAIHTYTILTIGDGLISQIPALIVSIAAGLLVTKSSAYGSTDQAITEQLGKYPRSMVVTAVLLLCIAVVPGMPSLQFIFLSILVGGLAYIIYNFHKPDVIDNAPKNNKEEEESITQSLRIDYVKVELGGGILTFADTIAENIKKLRKQLATDFGFVTPMVRVRDNLALEYNQYSIKIKEFESAVGSVEPEMFMVMNPSGQAINIEGKRSKDPSFGLEVVWVEKHLKKRAISKGYTVVEPAMVIMTHLTEVVKSSIPDLVTYSSTQDLLEEISGEGKKIVADVVPNKVGVAVIQSVLQRLLSEKVSIKDLPLIVESIAEIYVSNQNIMLVTEYVRSSLARQISFSNATKNKEIPTISLSGKWEKIFAEGIVDGQLAVEPNLVQEFINVVKSVFNKYALKGDNPVLLTSSKVRPYVRIVIEKSHPNLVVLAQSEIHNEVTIKNFGNI